MAETSMSPASLDTRNDWARPPAGVWFALLGGPAAWSAQLMLGWLVSGASCMGGGTSRWGALSHDGVQLLMALVAVACVATTLAALGRAWQAWRRSRNPALLDIHADDRPEFLAAAALLVSVLFVAAVTWTSLAQLWLPLCERVR